MDPILVTVQQFAQSRGVTYSPSDVLVLRALEDASAMFRSLAHQTITVVEDDVVELQGNWSRRLYLPERPVLAVSALTIETETSPEPSDWAVQEFTAPQYRWNRRGLLKLQYGCYFGGTDATVRATYSHGQAVPDDVIGVVCSIAARIVANPSRVVSERMGEHDVTWAKTDAAGGSAIGLTSEEQRVVEKYQPNR